MKDVLSLAAFAGKVLCLIVFVTALRPAGISAVQAPVRPASCSEILEDSRLLSFLAMPIRQYFVWVGSVLLVALFGADWCLPAPLHIHILKFPRMKGSTFVFVPITNGLNAW